MGQDRKPTKRKKEEKPITEEQNSGVVEPIMDNESIELPEEKKVKGAGDVIKAITNAVGIKTCDDCEERRKRMNKMFSFTRTAVEMTDEEIEFVKGLTRTLTMDQRKELGRIYAKTYNTRFNHCNCPGVYRQALDKLIIQADYQSIK